MAPRTILVASPRGFCAGVSYAIEIVDLVLDRYGPPVYVRHEIVHNRHVCDALRARGALFVEDLADVPEGSLLIFSAHGVAPAVRDEARARGLRVIDATCPLVTKVHLEALRSRVTDFDILLIGHRGHVEVEGTLGHAPDRMHLVETVADVEAWTCATAERVAVVTQTTLSVDDTRGDRRGDPPALPGRAHAAEGRHLLRDAEPPDGGQGRWRATATSCS